MRTRQARVSPAGRNARNPTKLKTGQLFSGLARRDANVIRRSTAHRPSTMGTYRLLPIRQAGSRRTPRRARGAFVAAAPRAAWARTPRVIPGAAARLLQRAWLLVLAFCAAAAFAHSARAAQPPGTPGSVVVIPVPGAISPATADFIVRGLARAADDRAQLAVLQLDTPGGLDTSMRQIIKAILASPVPVATYIAPGGARAASAGTYIVYASHIAAMAPGTNLGAATPIQMGIGGTEP